MKCKHGNQKQQISIRKNDVKMFKFCKIILDQISFKTSGNFTFIFNNFQRISEDLFPSFIVESLNKKANKYFSQNFP